MTATISTPTTPYSLPLSEWVGSVRVGGHGYDWLAWLGLGLIAAGVVWRVMQ